MDEKTIMKMVFGSHLYGTATEKSDKDFKGVFMPSKDDIFLGRISKSIILNTKKSNENKNTAEDVDIEFYSLHYFIKLACEGETVALDMLHAPNSMLIETSDIWNEIVKNRSKFYTRNLSAFVGYARKQAAKYGIKGSRLCDAKKVLDYIEYFSPGGFKSLFMKLKEVWNYLPEGEHIDKTKVDANGVRMYEVCGRKCGETASLNYLYEMVKKFYDNYGERARQAANDEGIDWKAVSHALRSAYQVKELLSIGTIMFPLKEAEFLRNVKSGMYNYIKEVAPKLEELMIEVEELSKNSTLPEHVDRKFWDKFIVDIVEKEVENDFNL